MPSKYKTEKRFPLKSQNKGNNNTLSSMLSYYSFVGV